VNHNYQKQILNLHSGRRSILLSIFPTTLLAGEVLYYDADNFGPPQGHERQERQGGLAGR